MTIARRVPVWLATAVGVVACRRPGPAAAATTGPATTPSHVTVDARSFDLRSGPPPWPALAYQLGFDPAARRPGSAAAWYLQAARLLTENEQALIDKARDADDAGDGAGFDRAAAELLGDRGHTLAVLGLLDEGGRREDGGLAAVWRDAGLDATLPQLNWMRGLANLLYVRAVQQARAAHPDEAVATLRLGYRLAHHVSDGSPLVCGLVGLGIAAITDEGVARLINRPDAPNLYWALATLPGPVVDFRHVMDGERQWQVATLPGLSRARGGTLTKDDWPALVRTGGFGSGPANAAEPPGASAAAAAAFVQSHPEVGVYYGRLHHVGPAEVAKADPQLLAATYMLCRFQAASDEAYKWVDQPYPLLIPHLRDLPAALRRDGLEPLNLFAIAAPSYARSVDSFAVGDRTRAAFTAVEALRSYAAGHNGRLPDRLSDVTDTPVPDNPVTGRPFEYAVDGDTATLGDHDPLLADRPLAYTVRVRRP